jgi:glycosyltransferase involved in cell wall biosynthesis
MKLVFVISSLKTGGAQTMMLRLLERLHPRFAAHVICLSAIAEMGPRIASLGVPVEGLGMKPGAPSPAHFMRLVRRLKSLAPKIVHTWMYHADLVGGLAARIAGVNAVLWSIRHANLDPDKNKRSTLAVAWACAQLSPWTPSKILSNSEIAKRVHIARGYAENKMVVLPNGFDLAPFRPDAGARASVRTELQIPSASPVVGLVGRFHPQKNIPGFFEAAGFLHQKLPEAHFVLAGEGLTSSNPAVVAAMKRAGIGGVTRLLGIRTDMPRLMAAMDVLASSSSGEAFPNVLGEAMACGVPCAVTDVGDSAYIVGDTGRVAPASDMAGLAGAMEQLLAMPAQERAVLGERARMRVAEHFEIGQIVKRYEALYDELGSM